MSYIYQADVYCDECGKAICDDIEANHSDLVPADTWDQSSYDSDDYPKSADLENEESDCPEHCAQCHICFENPLTSAGYKYVQERLNALPALTSLLKLREAGHGVLADWASWYSFTYWDAEDCEDDSRHTTPGWYSSEAY